MVKITIFQKQSGALVGFQCQDHAEYANENDIVCAGVSVLAISCVNAVEELTDTHFVQEEGDGMLRFFLEETHSDSQLLLKSFMLGAQKMEEAYPDFVDVIIQEV